jgi:hypothetical protein
MREKLNESKGAQIGLILILAAVAAYMLLGKGGGESGSTEETPVETTALTSESVPVASSGGGMGELPTTVPTKAPPKAFRDAYKAGGPVVLLVVHDGGIDDRYTKEALDVVREYKPVQAFVIPAKRIAEYASVTVGLNINQLPALIVMKSRKLSKGTPQATVLYGYQTPESISLAIRGAAYKGPERSTYHPG